MKLNYFFHALGAKAFYWIVVLFMSTFFVSGNNIIPTPKIVNLDPASPMVLNEHKFRINSGDAGESSQKSQAIKLLNNLPIDFSNDNIGIEIIAKVRGEDPALDNIVHPKIPDSIQNKPEAYFLEIGRQRILLYGLDDAGLLYSVQSLRQIVGNGTDSIECQSIIDFPTFTFRGVLDDISRGPLSNMHFLREQIRRFSLLKLNVFTLYVEHVIKTTQHFSYCPDEAITVGELRELSEFADSFNVKLMGSFQSLGHAKRILADPEYKHLGASERMFKPGDSLSLNFLREVYTELFPVFYHEIFNINCDEAYDLSRGGYLEERARQVGEGGVYLDHILPLFDHVTDNNKTPGIWGDMLLKYPEIIQSLPDNVVVFTWNYDDLDDFSSFIKPFADQEVDFIATPGVVNSYRIWPDLLEAEKNISRFANQAWLSGGLGLLTTVWDDGGRHFFACDWYGIAVGAESAWNPNMVIGSEFQDQFYKTLYGGKENQFSEFMLCLEEFQNTVKFKRLDNSLIEMTYDHDDILDVSFDTSEFSQLLTLVDRSLKLLAELSNAGSSQLLFSRNDFQPWIFKITELSHSIESVLDILRLGGAQALDESNRQVLVRRNLDNWKNLRAIFKDLWFRENRSYWSAEALKIYEEKVDFWLSMSQQQDNDRVYMVNANSSKYFTYWLCAGPLMMDMNENIDTDYFVGQGGETGLRPAAIDYYADHRGDLKSWRKVISRKPNQVVLDAYRIGMGGQIIYASCQLIVAEDRWVDYLLEHEGSCKIFVDGVEEGHKLAGRSDQFAGKVWLEEGRHYLTLKLHSPESGGWRFSMTLPGTKVEQNKYRYYIK